MRVHASGKHYHQEQGEHWMRILKALDIALFEIDPFHSTEPAAVRPHCRTLGLERKSSSHSLIGDSKAGADQALNINRESISL